MQKDQSYHESAILYNEGLAEFAENLAPTLEHEEVRKWCTAVGKQHRFHAKRHRSALNKLLLKQIPAPVESLADGLDVPISNNVEVEESGTVKPEPKVVSAEANLSTKAGFLAALTEKSESEEPTLQDGCSPYHDPLNPNCEFYPKEKVDG